MKEFVVLYILYPNLTNPSKVYYLKKDPKEKAPKIIHNKLVGIGGEIEEIDKEKLDYIIEATKRETYEELKIKFKKDNKIIYCGKIYRKSQNRIIHFLKIALNEQLNEQYIENEGNCKYYDIKFHLKNPKKFPPKDLKILNKILFSNTFFNENF